MRVRYMRKKNNFGIGVGANTVFTLRLVGISSSWFQNTAASVLHNQIGCLVRFRIQSS